MPERWVRGLLAGAWMLGAPLAAERVTHHVKVRYVGPSGPYVSSDPESCPETSRDGFDQFEGDLTGEESTLRTEGEVVYRGTMRRTTDIGVCDLLPDDADGVARYCNTQLVGGGEFDAELAVYAGRTEVYFKMEPKAGTSRVTVTSSCLAATSSEVGRAYLVDGEGFEHWIGPKSYGPGDRVGGPLRPGSYPEPPPIADSAVGQWTMDVGPPAVLRAEAGGPYRVERGQTVRLDGSGSEGQIQSYTWTLVGEPCAAYPPHLAPETPSRLTKQGAVVEMKALCRIGAKLRVSDGTGFEDDYTVVEVVPRAWKTETERPVTGKFTGNRLLWPCLHCQWGINLCAEEYARGEMSAGHQIHSERLGTWEGDKGYRLEPLRDPGGLWDGWWYLAKHELKMARAELVHVDLDDGRCPIVESERFNAKAGATVCDYQTLRAAIADHEHQHTVLLEKRLKQVDPAPDIEGFVASSGRRDQLVRAADQRIGIADGELFKETENDAEVAAILLKKRRFARQGVIFLPKTGGACSDVEYDSFDIEPTFAEMGVEGPL